MHQPHFLLKILPPTVAHRIPRLSSWQSCFVLWKFWTQNLDPQIQKTNALSLFCKKPSAVSEMKLLTGCDKLLLGQGYRVVTANCTAMAEWRREGENWRRSEKRPTKVSFRPSRISYKEIRDRTRGSVITKHRSLVWDKARPTQPITF